MKIKCSNYLCKFRDDNTKSCTLKNIQMVTDSWNRHGVVCNSVKLGNKFRKAYYTPDWLNHMEGQAKLDKKFKRKK